MYSLNDIQISRQHREDVARQVENNRLARQLRAYVRLVSGTASSLQIRALIRSPREGHTAEC